LIEIYVIVFDFDFEYDLILILNRVFFLSLVVFDACVVRVLGLLVLVAYEN